MTPPLLAQIVRNLHAERARVLVLCASGCAGVERHRARLRDITARLLAMETAEGRPCS